MLSPFLAKSNCKACILLQFTLASTLVFLASNENERGGELAGLAGVQLSLIHNSAHCVYSGVLSLLGSLSLHCRCFLEGKADNKLLRMYTDTRK